MKKIISLIVSFLMFFSSYLFSFLPDRIDKNFDIESIETVAVSGIENGIIADKAEFDFDGVNCGMFNYFGVSYKSDAYMKGTVTYTVKGSEYTEEFFLEPSDGTKPFYSFIDGVLDKTKSTRLCSMTFEPLNKSTATFTLLGADVFNREVPDENIYLETDEYKIGVNLLWGGALDYLEDMNSKVEAVNVDGKIKVDSDASVRYGVKAVNTNVNLINRHDTGRLVQQSYYGADGGGYESGYYEGTKWRYNPVQGGNVLNESSKIVDYVLGENYIYIKCRPLDWAKPAEDITPSYMEATYSIVGNTVEVYCRFVDYSGYPETLVTQELPAFYCVAPLSRYVYYSGDAPWTGDKNYSHQDDLIFWPDAGYPNFTTTEGWSAFTGEFDDSFGIGLYTPHNSTFLAGIFERDKTVMSDPSVDVSTSYIAAVQDYTFKSFVPREYNYYLTTGTAEEIQSNFSEVRE